MTTGEGRSRRCVECGQQECGHVGHRPEWGEVALLLRGKYLVEEREDGWHVLSREYEQGVSAAARSQS